MKYLTIKILKKIGLYKTYKVPEYVIKNFIELNSEKYSILKNTINDFCRPENYATSENRLADIDAILSGRLIEFRENHIPFLVKTIGLKNKEILEIGCGTGSSSLAMAEQGALVTGIDIDENSLKIAKKRFELYGLNHSFENANSVNLKEHFENKNWDIIIFFASLEHMTPHERIKSLKEAYSLIKKGGHLCIFGTPNRLWPYDLHTSYIPFYMWLQDEIALDYSVFSPRVEFAEMHKNKTPSAYEKLYRWGRGLSFHEIEIALKKVSKINR